MTELYSKLAEVYHEMYQNIFDYKKEFLFYNKVLKKYGCKRILEIGCGSGNLAPYFVESDYDYAGVDLSQDMLDIAKKVEPKAKYLQADMRNLKLRKKFDAVLITGKSFTHLVTNDDVRNTLNSVYKILKRGGIFIFDNYNAEKIIGLKRKRFEHEVESNDKRYRRVSIKTPNLETGWTENWEATYYIKEKGKKMQTIKDNSIVRSFTKDELKLFLKLQDFSVERIIDHGSAFTILAKR